MSERRARQDEGRSIFDRLGGKADGSKSERDEPRIRSAPRGEARRELESEGPIKCTRFRCRSSLAFASLCCFVWARNDINFLFVSVSYLPI